MKSIVTSVLLGAATLLALPCGAQPASDLGLRLPPHGVAERVSRTQRVNPNTKAVFAELDGPGVIRHLWVTPTGAYEGNRQTVIRIYFDGATVPNVEAPIGDFFGVMHGRQYYDLNSIFLSVKAWEGYACYFPMPFARSARIEFEAGPTGNSVYLQCDWTRYPGQKMEETQRFCARWRRESPAESYGRDFLMLDADGPGRLVGFVYGVRQSDDTDRWSHGGSDNIYLDGEADVPSYLRGIGGEDTFGAGYGGVLHPPDTQLYTGMPYYTHEDLGEARPAVTFAAYRFFVSDVIEFQKSIQLRFGSMRNDICTTVYWYQDGAPRPYVRLPDWPKLLTNTNETTRLRRNSPQVEIKREEIDLPLPDSGSWEIAGPYDLPATEGKLGLPPAAPHDPVSVPAPYQAIHGFVDINHVLRPHTRGAGVFYSDKFAVARTTVQANREMDAEFRLAWDDQLVLQLNDEAPVDFGNHTAFRPSSVKVRLRAGPNRIVIMLSNTRGNNHGGWIFNLRIKDPSGTTLVPHAGR